MFWLHWTITTEFVEFCFIQFITLHKKEKEKGIPFHWLHTSGLQRENRPPTNTRVPTHTFDLIRLLVLASNTTWVNASANLKQRYQNDTEITRVCAERARQPCPNVMWYKWIWCTAHPCVLLYIIFVQVYFIRANRTASSTCDCTGRIDNKTKHNTIKKSTGM